MEFHSCRGLKRLAVNPLLYDPSHYDARHNRGDNVKQKVLHRRHLLVSETRRMPHSFDTLSAGLIQWAKMGLDKNDVLAHTMGMVKSIQYTYPQNLGVIMWESYPAKDFLPLLGLNKETFHAWGRRGNIDLPPTGRGKAVELTGHELVFLSTLVTLSNLGQPPSTGKTGLKREVAIFTDSFVRGITEYRYCIARTRPLGDCFMEWSLCNSANPEHHIVDSAGGEKVPGWIVLDLLDISERVAKGLYSIYNAR